MLKLVGDCARYLRDKNPAEAETRLELQARTGGPLGDARFLKRAERITGRHLKPEQSEPKPKEERRKKERGKTRK